MRILRLRVGNAAAALTVALLGSFGLLGASGEETPPPRPPWAKEFEVFGDLPMTVAYLSSLRKWQSGPFLLEGVRPPADRPSAGRTRSGGPGGAGDWTFEDATGAIRVSGLAAPEVGRRIVLAARFEDGEGEPSLRGIALVAVGKREGTTVIRVGEFVRFPLCSTKSFSCYPEVVDDAGAVEWFPKQNGLIVRGARPGSVTIKIFAESWNRPDPELREQLALQVTGP